MSAPSRRPVVGVMGSGSAAHEGLSVPLGRALAQGGYHLLTGGGGGVMEAVSRAFAGEPSRLGVVIGILPGGAEDGRPPLGYPNAHVDVCIRTHLPLSGSRGAEPASRNHLNVLSSDVVVALPGGEGTASEVQLARRYGVPVVGFMDDARRVPGWPAELDIATSVVEVEEFIKLHIERSRLYS